MGFFSIFKRLCRFGIEFAIVALIITFLPGLPPAVNISKPYKVTKTTITGKLSLNNKLDQVEILHNNLLHGPESLIDDKNFIYTSLHLGNIVKIVGSHITPVAKFGKPCKGVYQESICGRPLGLTFGKDGDLYAVDTYYGIFRVDVKTGKKIQIVAQGQNISGRQTRSPNAVDIACNGDIYWSDSSSDFTIQDTFFAFLANPTGRLIRYNALVGKNEVLIDNLLYANGVALSYNEDFVLVCEMGKNKILRYNLKGPKKGTTEVFIDGLPGIPDNIRSIGKSGFLITLSGESHSENPNLIQVFSQFPNVRKFVARVLGLIESSFRTINGFYPNEICEKGVHFVGHAEPVSSLLGRSGVVHVSENGEVMDVLWTSSVARFSEAQIIKDHLYIGSAMNRYLARIPLSKVGWSHLQKKSDSLSLKQQRCSELYKDISDKNVPINEKRVEQKVAPKVASKPITTTTTIKPPTSAEQSKSTSRPTSSRTSTEQITVKPTTPESTTVKPTTVKPTTVNPTTVKPTTVKPTTVKPTTAKPTTAKPTTVKPTTAKPTTLKPTTEKPTTEKPTTSKPTVVRDTTTSKPISESLDSKPIKMKSTKEADIKSERAEELKDSSTLGSNTKSKRSKNEL